MNKAILLIGGNMGDRTAQLLRVKVLLEQHGIAVIKQSKVYETAAWGKTDQPNFLNQVLITETALLPSDLLFCLLEIEQTMGRLRVEKYGPRIMDIDILFYNDEIVDRPELQIPHPQISNRRFVLVPLNEIAGNYLHPVEHKTINQLLADCSDTLEVTIFSSE